MTTEILEDFANFIAEEGVKPTGYNWWKKQTAGYSYKRDEQIEVTYTTKELVERYLKTKKI